LTEQSHIIFQCNHIIFKVFGLEFARVQCFHVGLKPLLKGFIHDANFRCDFSDSDSPQYTSEWPHGMLINSGPHRF